MNQPDLPGCTIHGLTLREFRARELTADVEIRSDSRRISGRKCGIARLVGRLGWDRNSLWSVTSRSRRRLPRAASEGRGSVRRQNCPHRFAAAAAAAQSARRWPDWSGKEIRRPEFVMRRESSQIPVSSRNRQTNRERKRAKDERVPTAEYQK